MERLFDKQSFETVFIVLGLLAGFVKASQRMLRGEPIGVKAVFGHSVISAFSCLMAGIFLDWKAPQLPLEAKMFLGGMTGYWGIAGLSRLTEIFLGRR